MRKIFEIIAFLALTFSVEAFRFGKQTSPKSLDLKEKELFQVSTSAALIQGVLEGDYTYADLMRKGSYGIGLFNGADGEMIALDGSFYQVDYNGKVTLVKSSQIAPFAQVIFFKPTSKFSIKSEPSFQRAAKQIYREFFNKNVPYAVFLKGTFSWVKVRTLQKQQKPYPSFLDVTNKQREFTKKNIEGMAFGFWFPDYWAGISVPGFQMHFLSEDLSFGGHIENMALENVSVSIQPVYEYQIHLPDVQSFSNANLDKNVEHEILESQSSPSMNYP